MPSIPPGLATLESAARHLQMSTRRVQALSAATPLRQITPVSLGRALGTYRFLPQLGIALLRQVHAQLPWRLICWQAALSDVLVSEAWRQALDALGGDGRGLQRGARSGRVAVEQFLLSARVRPLMETLHQESSAALERHGLAQQVQSAEMLVDRLEDDEDAVILVGPDQRAFLLSRSLLQIADLDREKARGVLLATQTSTGIVLDVWPAVGAGEGGEWIPDPELLAQQVEVGV